MYRKPSVDVVEIEGGSRSPNDRNRQSVVDPSQIRRMLLPAPMLLAISLVAELAATASPPAVIVSPPESTTGLEKCGEVSVAPAAIPAVGIGFPLPAPLWS